MLFPPVLDSILHAVEIEAFCDNQPNPLTPALSPEAGEREKR
jgi:hypothetical protein